MNSPGFSRILMMSGPWANVCVQWKRKISKSEREKTACLVIFVVNFAWGGFFFPWEIWKCKSGACKLQECLMCEREKRGCF